MTKRVYDLLHQKHSFPLEAAAGLEEDDYSILVDMVRSGNAQTNRLRALDLLVACGGDHAMDLLAELLRHDSGQDALLSSAAATHVTRFPAHWAEALLLDRLQANDRKKIGGHAKPDAASEFPALVMTKMVASLGRCGSQRAVPALQALAGDPGSDPMVLKQVNFALALIGCREGLRALEPTPIDTQTLQPDIANSRSLRVRAASADDVEQATRSMVSHLYGVHPDSKHAFWLECAANRMMVLPSRTPDNTELAALMLERPWLAALVIRRSPEDHSYSVWRVVLTHPQDGQVVRVTAHRTDGTIMLEGKTDVNDDNATLRLHAIAWPGAIAATVEATLHGSVLDTLKVRVAKHRLAGSTPHPWVPPHG